MVNILIVVVIILVFSFIMGLIITGNDNRISEKERQDMVDDPSVLFNEESRVEENTNSGFEKQDIHNDVNGGVLDNHLPIIDDGDMGEKEPLAVQDNYMSIPSSNNKLNNIDIDDEII